HAIRANQGIAAYGAVGFQLESDARVILREPGAARAEVDRIRFCTPNSPGKHVEQVWAVNGEVRKTVALDRSGPEIEQLPGLTGLPVADFLAQRFAGKRLELLADTERIKNACSIGGELDARADFLQLQRLFIDRDIDPRTQ